MRLVLVGNPNVGKSSLFNLLTGLNQKVGNFPGVTVEKKTGYARLPNGDALEVWDLPGTYSIYPKSPEEAIVVQTLLSPQPEVRPDVVLVVADATNLKRNLLLYTQIRDLGLPTVLVLNQIDIATQRGIQIDYAALSQSLGTPVVWLNGRTGDNLSALIETLAQPITPPEMPLYLVAGQESSILSQIRQTYQLSNDYQAWQYLQQTDQLPFLTADAHQAIVAQIQKHQFNSLAAQTRETLARYEIIDDILAEATARPSNTADSYRSSERIDRWLLHPVWGYALFGAILLLIFQALFVWAKYPADLLDATFGSLQLWTKANLPAGIFTDLLADGILAGLGGIVVFVPQIAVLFVLIGILEETGYMARVVVLTDRVFRGVGLNGRSVVPLLSGVACAVPAIMATRTIENWRERLITIFVTPLMSCSARLPVYTVLIALIVPDTYWGIFHVQGLALLAMYLLGFVAAVLSAWLMHWGLTRSTQGYLLLELPSYKYPRWQNLGITVWEKVRVFLLEAGRVILAISIILWALASYGPAEQMRRVEAEVKKTVKDPAEQEAKINAAKLENSYAGILGKTIEPLIAPLGYDWKIGIALITSFAAREVFVGTLATIYSLEEEKKEDTATLQARLRAEINPDTGKPRFTPAVAMSLLVFYAFALQCMSTLAVSYRETRSWKYPLGQFVYMTSLAYCCAWLVFRLMQ